MLVAREHSEWLALLEISGPFPGLPLLREVFPQGLDAHDAEVARDLRLAHDEWEDDADPAIHRAWVRYVLRRVLDWPDDLVRAGQAIPTTLLAAAPEQGVTLRPDLVLVDTPGRGQTPRVLVMIWPRDQGLERPPTADHWDAPPLERLRLLLATTGVPLGIVTNGERWTLVAALANGENATYATWYATLWREEPITLRAWRSLLGITRIIGAPAGELLADLILRGAEDQRDVTTRLGDQVRQAIEVLIRRIDQIGKDTDRPEVANLDPTVLYHAALTLMMRLIFLFFAEENRLLERGGTLYTQSYAVGTIREQLRAAADRDGEERLERFGDAWCRLLATCRAIHAGVEHDELRLSAHGGDLFDPDRFPFLEGRAAGTNWRETPSDPLPIDNRTVLHLLEALQILQAPVSKGGDGVEPRRLSFRALDVEQIGHVYEGLLDHTARRASAPILGLRVAAKASVTELPLASLETLARQGDAALVAELAKLTGRSARAIARDLAAPLDDQADARLLGACDNDPDLRARVRPFAGLLRTDYADRPVVITAGGVYVTSGEDRRSSGTHYTPRSLTEPIVKHTLDPLVYHGPAAGLPPEQWTLRPASAILQLKVLDMAMGSGAFLVEATRYLAARLQEAWSVMAADQRAPGGGGLAIASDGSLVATGAAVAGFPADLPAAPWGIASPVGVGRSSHPTAAAPGEDLVPLPLDQAEREIVARRLIADRCIYGVDKNPMAVEMAKLSLWLVTMAHDRPFTFLDHALRAGDSLLGINHLDQLKYWSLDLNDIQPQPIIHEQIRSAVERAIILRQRIALRQDFDARDLSMKATLLREAEETMSLAQVGANMLVGVELSVQQQQRKATLKDLLNNYSLAMDAQRTAWEQHFSAEGATPVIAAVAALRAHADDLLAGRRPFHWPLEFPEVFDPAARDANPGFDAVIGNPPFMGGKKITGALGVAYRDYLVGRLADGQTGSADLCAYFFLRATDLMRRDSAGAGLLATNTIAQGDTRAVALDQIAARGVQIPRAVPSRPWPGEAALEVAHVWLWQGDWAGPRQLDDRAVGTISPYLAEASAVQGNPFPLAENAGKSFIGSYVLGMGFVLTPEAAADLIARDPRNREVLFPYLNGEDLNSRSDQSPSRWVINFHDWPLERAETYPDCMAIVREKVKPERDRLANGDATARDRARRWWQFARQTMALYAAIAGMERVLVITIVSRTVAFAIVPNDQVFAHKLAVFSLDADLLFGLLQSSFHYFWAWTYSSTMKADLNYSPSDCFDTYPFPECLRDEPIGDAAALAAQRARLEEIGAQYYAQRQGIMQARQEGLTKTYNRLHNPHETASDLAALRRLHAAMDAAVAAAYGWDDLDLGHGFHATKQGTRYTISDAARRAVLDRLLLLNHARHAAEVAAGPPPKGKGRQRGNGTRGDGNGARAAAGTGGAEDGGQPGLWDATEAGE